MDLNDSCLVSDNRSFTKAWIGVSNDFFEKPIMAYSFNYELLDKPATRLISTSKDIALAMRVAKRYVNS